MSGKEGLLDGSMDAGRRETFSTAWEGTEGPVWISRVFGRREASRVVMSGERPFLGFIPFGRPEMKRGTAERGGMHLCGVMDGI